MSILLQQKNVGDYSYMSSPNIYYRAEIYQRVFFFLLRAYIANIIEHFAIHHITVTCKKNYIL